MKSKILKLELEQYFDVNGNLSYSVRVDDYYVNENNSDFSTLRASVNNVLQNVMNIGLTHFTNLEVEFIE